MTDIRSGDIRITRLGRVELNETIGVKPRPTIILARTRKPHIWLVMGLTTNPRFENGKPRARLRDWETTAGLHQPAYLWSDYPHRLPEDQIGRRVGEVGEDVVRSFLPPWYQNEPLDM